MAISDDFTIDYTNRMIYHSSGTTIYTVNEFYSWLMDELDESGTIDDTIPITSQTPTQYTLTNSWYLNQYQYASLEYLRTGAFSTSGWDATSSSTGIRVLEFGGTYTNAISTDIGKAVSGSITGDSGTLLDYDNPNKKWLVRIDDIGDDFDNTSETISIASGTGTGVLTTTSITGEHEYANLFTIGTLEAKTQLYVVQANQTISPWWSTGLIDIIINVQEAGTLIDEGYVTVYARQYTKLYDHFVVDASSGGRIPVPLATFNDSNNSSGFRQMIVSTASASFTNGEVIQDDSDATIQGIITSSSGTAPNITLEYYLYNSSQTDFSSSTGSFTGQSSGSTATAVDPTDTGPTTTSGITFTFGATSQNLGNGNGNKPYDVIIDCNNNSLTEVYEYLKYITRYGSVSNLNGHDGEQYLAVGDIRLLYDAQTGNYAEGLTVTGSSSNATGIIVSDHDAGSSGALVLVDTTGNFEDDEIITDTSSGSATVDLSSDLDEISPSKQSPFGTFAGGKFFGARGVWLDNIPTNDLNNYQLIDSTGTEQVPPTSVIVTINNTANGDRVSVFRTTGNNEIVDKSIFDIKESHGIGVSYLRINPQTIPADTPSSGVIRVVRRNASGTILGEDRYSYSSFTTGFSEDEFILTSTTTHAYDTDDTAYVPYIDEEATSTSISQSLTFVTDRYVLIRVRIVGMLPFSIKGQITTNGLTVQTIRTTDSVYQ